MKPLVTLILLISSICAYGQSQVFTADAEGQYPKEITNLAWNGLKM